MNKTELIETVAKDTGQTVDVTRTIINSMIETIKSKLLYGVNVKIKDFITFELHVSKATKRYNPQNGTEIDVPKKYRIKTIWSKLFRDKLAAKTVY